MNQITLAVNLRAIEDLECSEDFRVRNFALMQNVIEMPQGGTREENEKKCGDCAHEQRCVLIFGHAPTDTYCDWVPSKFRDKLK